MYAQRNAYIFKEVLIVVILEWCDFRWFLIFVRFLCIIQYFRGDDVYYLNKQK